MRVNVGSMMSELRDIATRPGVHILMKTRPTLVQQTSFASIRYLLEEHSTDDGACVVLNLFRAHPFLNQLMKKKKVENRERVVFIDALFNISGDCRKYADNAVIIPCPFSKEFEKKVLKALEDIGEIDSLIIDDIMALQNYWERERIERFLDMLMDNLSLMGGPPLFIIADTTKDEWLLESASGLCDEVITVDGTM